MWPPDDTNIFSQHFFTTPNNVSQPPNNFSQPRTIFHNLEQFFTTPDNFSQPQTNCHNPMHFFTIPDILWQPQGIFHSPHGAPPPSPGLRKPTVLITLNPPLQYWYRCLLMASSAPQVSMWAIQFFSALRAAPGALSLFQRLWPKHHLREKSQICLQFVRLRSNSMCQAPTTPALPRGPLIWQKQRSALCGHAAIQTSSTPYGACNNIYIYIYVYTYSNWRMYRRRCKYPWPHLGHSQVNTSFPCNPKCTKLQCRFRGMAKGCPRARPTEDVQKSGPALPRHIHTHSQHNLSLSPGWLYGVGWGGENLLCVYFHIGYRIFDMYIYMIIYIYI